MAGEARGVARRAIAVAARMTNRPWADSFGFVSGDAVTGGVLSIPRCARMGVDDPLDVGDRVVFQIVGRPGSGTCGVVMRIRRPVEVVEELLGHQGDDLGPPSRRGADSPPRCRGVRSCGPPPSGCGCRGARGSAGRPPSPRGRPRRRGARLASRARGTIAAKAATVRSEPSRTTLAVPRGVDELAVGHLAPWWHKAPCARRRSPDRDRAPTPPEQALDVGRRRRRHHLEAPAPPSPSSRRSGSAGHRSVIRQPLAVRMTRGQGELAVRHIARSWRSDWPECPSTRRESPRT